MSNSSCDAQDCPSLSTKSWAHLETAQSGQHTGLAADSTSTHPRHGLL